jgi:large subunit ribosomal protein L5e
MPFHVRLIHANSVNTVLRFKRQFSTYLADGIGSGDIEEIYTNAYAAIREDPTFKPTEKSKDWKTECKKHKTSKLTYAQRKANIEAKIQKFKEAGGAAADEEASDEE